MNEITEIAIEGMQCDACAQSSNGWSANSLALKAFAWTWLPRWRR